MILLCYLAFILAPGLQHSWNSWDLGAEPSIFNPLARWPPPAFDWDTLAFAKERGQDKDKLWCRWPLTYLEDDSVPLTHIYLGIWVLECQGEGVCRPDQWGRRSHSFSVDIPRRLHKCPLLTGGNAGWLKLCTWSSPLSCSGYLAGMHSALALGVCPQPAVGAALLVKALTW